MNDSFREQIEYLADRAGEERARVAEEAQPVKLRSPLRKFLWVGAVIALLEAALLGYQATQDSRELSAHSAPHPLLKRYDCAGERYRTSVAIAAYVKATGRIPETLDALVGTYILSRPVDPLTKLPLSYKRLPNGFRLECAKLPK